jgi:CRISPR-associated protein (TIGR03986 family)
MLRNLLEIVSFSKIERVSGHERLFFRAVASNPDKESWGKEYKTYVDPKKIQAGYLKKDEQGWYIQPAKTEHGATFAWVRETSLSLTNLKKFNDGKYEPQYISVSYETVAVDNTDRAKRLFAQNVELQDIHQKKGVLVNSGNMKQGNETSPRRNHCVVFECLVFEENSNSSKLRLNDKTIEHYRNALTDFQKGAPFNKDWGVLEENRPVFYRPPKNGSKIVGFFGQSPNFRIPYSPQGDGHATTVIDFIPEKLRKLAIIDLADAIFGWVKKESEEEKLPENFAKQRAGRVFVTDALYKSSQKGIWYEDEPFSPQVLSEPKPTSFSHYLVQPEENNPNADPLKLKHYASQPVTETVIRGHKLYWHKGSDPKFKLAPPKKVIGSTKKVSDTQTTLITPINRGVVFTFDIHFENLSKVELGALLWVLSLSNERSQKLETGKSSEEYCFSLGMGKPLGMGAVKIDYNLYLIKRNERYSKLFNNEQWKTGEEDQSQTGKEEGESVKAFEEYVLDRICCQDYPINKSREQLQHLKELPRIEMLLAMLQCHEILDIDKTRYMRIEPKPSEYAERPVLPTPLDIRGIPDNRRFPDVNPSSGGAGENKSIDNPKKKVISSKPKPKPKPNNKSNPERTKGGDSTNRATQRPPRPKN